MIQPPAKLSLADLQLWMLDQVAEHYLAFDDISRCGRCEAACETQRVFISIHASEWGDQCAGSGRVERLLVPRCLICEPDAPENLYTCAHLPLISHSLFERKDLIHAQR